MSRKFMALLVSSAMVFGSVSTSAWSATDLSAATVQTSEITKNQAPLPAGGAAGIKQAQGIEDSPWLGLGLVAAVVIIAWVLLDDDEDDDSSSGTD